MSKLSRKALLNISLIFFIYCVKNKLLHPLQIYQIVNKFTEHFWSEILSLWNLNRLFLR